MKKTFTTTLMALLLCVCMVFGLTACGGFTQDDIDNAVNEATAPLNEQITALEADIAEKEAKIAALEAEKTALTTEKGELLADIEEIEAEVATLESEKAALEAEVAALEEEKATLTTDKATLEASIAAKNNDIATLNATISDLNTEKANLTARVTELEASISEKDTKIAELNSSIETLTEEKQTLSDKVAELEGKNEQLEAENAALKNCLAGKHVIDTENEISYAWSKDYSTCTATGICVHCDNEATEVANGVTGDNKITATFENSSLEAQVVHTVTTYDELDTLLQSGEVVTIRLDATLENIQSLFCRYGTTAVLDMNGNDITFEPGYSLGVDSSSLTLKGVGTITASGTTAIKCRGSLFIEDNVTVNGSWYAIGLEGYPYANATVNISGGTINAQGNGVSFIFFNDYTSVTITGGTFSCDPTAYVDTEKYAVTENGDGTWTVDCNHKNSTHTTVTDNGDGAHSFTCTVCDSNVKENHTLIYTDNGNGAHSFTCTVCGSSGKENHSYDEDGECICGAKVLLVSTPDELLAAIEQGGNIKLVADIELASRLMVQSNVSIDLNEKTLSRMTGNIMYVYSGCTVSISNGELVSNSTTIENYGTLSIDNCTLTGHVVLNNNVETTVTNSTLNGPVSNYGGTMILYDSVTLGANTDGNTGLASYDGSIVCYFDPSDMLYTAYAQSVVTNNGDGTWTVTKAV